MQTDGTDVGQINVDHDGTALTAFLRVKLTTAGTKLEACGLNDEGVGTLAEAVLANTTRVAVVPKQAPVVKMVAAEAIAKGAAVYGAAAGKIDTTAAGSTVEGITLDAASGDGSVIRVMRLPASAVPTVA